MSSGPDLREGTENGEGGEGGELDFIACKECTFNNDATATNCSMCGATLTLIKPMIDIELVKNMLKTVEIQKKIKQNYDQAHELIPESFFHIDMLYFLCEINGVPVKAFVDTGAQISIMSKSCATLCGIDDLIDYSYKGTTVGVGEKDILGRIWMIDIDLGDHSLPCSFTILDDFKIDIIFGLNMLISHGCMIDLKNKCLKIGDDGIVIPFVEKE